MIERTATTTTTTTTTATTTTTHLQLAISPRGFNLYLTGTRLETLPNRYPPIGLTLYLTERVTVSCQTLQNFPFPINNAVDLGEKRRSAHSLTHTLSSSLSSLSPLSSFCLRNPTSHTLSHIISQPLLNHHHNDTERVSVSK